MGEDVSHMAVQVQRDGDRGIWQLLQAGGTAALNVSGELSALTAEDVRDLTATFERMAARRRLRLVR